MIKFELLKDAGVLLIEPQSALSADDFRQVAKVVDPYLNERGKLTGLLIESKSFPGWDSFGALIQHMRYIHDTHRKIGRVAAVTDAGFLKIVPKIAQHFVHPEIRVFASGERAKALSWLQTGA
jgi:SpoIIAA-like